MEAGVPADAEWRAVDMLNAMVWLWLAVVALALILEASTMSLVSEIGRASCRERVSS